MLGSRLKLARKRAGLSLRALAEIVEPSITAQAISKYENGQMMPNSRVLVGLARALDVSLDFLMGAQIESLEGVEFRNGSGISAKDRARIEATVVAKIENYLAIEEILGLNGEDIALDQHASNSIDSYESAEKLANDLRAAWNLGDDAIPSMTNLLEDRGVRVIETELPSKVGGMTCKVNRIGEQPAICVIVVSSLINIERKRFTLAHELAHRLIGSVSDSSMKLERAMDRFAGAFLVPADHLRRELGENRTRIAYHEILRLKHMYGVSAAMLLMRLGQARIIADETVRYAFRTVAKKWRTSEPDALAQDGDFGASEMPSRYEGLVFRALAEDLISPVRAASLLGTSLREVERGLKWNPEAQIA